jgi:2,3-bisphosphoglycerate-independent phosphoglycerate mutase
MRVTSVRLLCVIYQVFLTRRIELINNIHQDNAILYVGGYVESNGATQGMIMATKSPTVLVILDGFGYREESDYNAIAHAQTPALNRLRATYPHTLLEASGSAVGLLPGYAGNSEVGHLTIGAGRTILQPGTIIHNDIQDGTFLSNEVLKTTLSRLPATKKLHIMGLLSDAGVHSSVEHLYAFIQAAELCGIRNIVVHPFLDGRDTPPRSARAYLEALQKYMDEYGGTIGSVHGRFYAMDRDKNWGRTAQSYRVLTGDGPMDCKDWASVLSYYYERGLTDEFIPPTLCTQQGVISDGDGIIFFNFRPDRARQLTESFVHKGFNAFKRKHIDLAFFITPTDYGLPTVVLYAQKPVVPTLKEVLSQAGLTLYTIAETEKYAHVTYFFGGGREEAFEHEDRVLIPSIRAQNYIHYPCMSACKITRAVLQSLKASPHDFYLINYANADMVGHSGDFKATVKAIECVDKQIKKLVETIVYVMHGTLYITADHGNAEEKWDYVACQPRTAHTTNKVPFMVVKHGLECEKVHLPLRTLADIAPYVIRAMGLEVPAVMQRHES